jgi:hypothetical protein
MLGRFDHHLRDCDQTARLERLPQQRIHPVPALGRREVVGTLEKLRRYFLQRNEGDDVYGLGRLDVGAFEVLLGEHDVPVLLVLVALDHVLQVDFFARLLAVALVSEKSRLSSMENLNSLRSSAG